MKISVHTLGFLVGFLLWACSTVLITSTNYKAFQDNMSARSIEAKNIVRDYINPYEDLVAGIFALGQSSDSVIRPEMDHFFKAWRTEHHIETQPENINYYGWYAIGTTDGYYTKISPSYEPSLTKFSGADDSALLTYIKSSFHQELIFTKFVSAGDGKGRAGYIVLSLDRRGLEKHIADILSDKFGKGMFRTEWVSEDANISNLSLISPAEVPLFDEKLVVSFSRAYEWNFLRDNLIGLITGMTGFLLTALLFLSTQNVFRSSDRNLRDKELVENQLSDQKSFFETIFENLPGILFIKDVRNDYRYINLNKEGEKFFGLTREHMIGKTDRDFFSEEESSFFRNIDIATMQGRKVIDVPCEVVTTPSGEAFVHTRKVPIYGADGEPLYLVGLSQDITLRKKNEMELADYRQNLEKMVDERTSKLKQAMSKAEEANRLKSEFLATMSHEIRSPMSGVLGMAELMLDTPLTIEQKALTRTIINSGEVLMNIIEDILDFSKIEANKLELDPIAVNMLELVDDVCLLYSPRAREKALEIAVRYMPGTEQFVYADPLRIRQILGNLLNNAIKFTQKGYISITVWEEKAPDQPEDKVRLYFRVDDTGIGIAENDCERIFEKFSQANSSTTRDYGGTGLGLSICRKLVEMMSGEIGVQSEPGKGSAFIFHVPMTRNREEMFVQPKPPVLQGLRVLVVDDLAVIRDMLCEQLSMAGMICDSASGGHQALQKLVAAKDDDSIYDLIIIDYLMPGMNGEMLARAISDEPAFRNICLVMLTAAGNPILGDDFADKGFSAYISKPVKAQRLIDTLAVIWEKFSNGQTDTLIRVDTSSLGTVHASESAIRLEGTKILLVEDSRLNQAFVEEVLEQLSCEHETVSNGQEALDILSRQEFDLVLMDCQMPIMDGFEASRRIRGLKEQGKIPKDMPVLALTANAMMGDRQRCLDAGMDDYITKPVRKKELKEKIYFWIKNEPAAGAGKDDAELQSDPEETAGADELINDKLLDEAKALLKDKFDFLLGCYIEDVENYIREIQDAITSRNTEGVVRPAHTIKSTSKRMGAISLSNIARDIEQTAREASNNTANDFWEKQGFSEELQNITRVFEQTRAYLTGR